jgi:hypothetical protein
MVMKMKLKSAGMHDILEDSNLQNHISLFSLNTLITFSYCHTGIYITTVS